MIIGEPYNKQVDYEALGFTGPNAGVIEFKQTLSSQGSTKRFDEIISGYANLTELKVTEFSVQLDLENAGGVKYDIEVEGFQAYIIKTTPELDGDLIHIYGDGYLETITAAFNGSSKFGVTRIQGSANVNSIVIKAKFAYKK